MSQKVLDMPEIILKQWCQSFWEKNGNNSIKEINVWLKLFKLTNVLDNHYLYPYILIYSFDIFQPLKMPIVEKQCLLLN